MEILPGPVLWSLFLLHCCIGGKKSVHYFLCIGDLLKFGGGGGGRPNPTTKGRKLPFGQV